MHSWKYGEMNSIFYEVLLLNLRFSNSYNDKVLNIP